MKHKKVLEPQCIPNTRKMPKHDLVGKAFSKPKELTPREQSQLRRKEDAQNCIDRVTRILDERSVSLGRGTLSYEVQEEKASSYSSEGSVTIFRNKKKVAEIEVLNRDSYKYSDWSWKLGYRVTAIRLPRDRDGWGGYGWGDRYCMNASKAVEIVDEFGTPEDDIEEKYKVSSRKERELSKERDAAKKIRDLVITSVDAGKLTRLIIKEGPRRHDVTQEDLVASLRDKYNKYDAEYKAHLATYDTFYVEHDKIAQAYDIWKEESGVTKSHGRVMS